MLSTETVNQLDLVNNAAVLAIGTKAGERYLRVALALPDMTWGQVIFSTYDHVNDGQHDFNNLNEAVKIIRSIGEKWNKEAK